MRRVLYLVLVLQIALSAARAETISATYSGEFRLWNAGDASTMGGVNYNAGYRQFGLPTFQIRVNDTDGDGFVDAHVRVAKTGGHFKANETISTSKDDSIEPDGHTQDWGLGPLLVNMNSDLQPASYYSDLRVSAPGQTGSGAITANAVVELLGPGGTVIDSVTLTVVVALELTLQDYSVPSPTISMGTTVIQLYEGGVLPPGGRPASQEGGSPFNTMLEGTVFNDSDVEQGIQIWALDANGDPVLHSELVISPGAVADLENFGADVLPGGEAFIMVTGEITGGIGGHTIQHGDTESGTFVFPPQVSNDTQIFIENVGELEHEISVGNEGGMQEFVMVPPGISEKKTTYGGEPLVYGGESIEVIPGAGSDRTLVVVVPEGNGSAQAVSSATVPGSGGATTSTTVVEFPSGNQVMTGTNDSPPDSPSPPGSGTTGSVGSSVTSGQGIDKAADAINAIRSEAAAVSSKFEDISESALSSEIDTEGLTAGLETAKTDLASITDGVGEETGEFLILKPEFTSISPGSVDSYTFNVLGTDYTIRFDYPGISFFRNLLLVFCSLCWFIFLVKISKT